MSNTALFANDLNTIGVVEEFLIAPNYILVDDVQTQGVIESFALEDFDTALTLDDVATQGVIEDPALEVVLNMNDLTTAPALEQPTIIQNATISPNKITTAQDLDKVAALTINFVPVLDDLTSQGVIETFELSFDALLIMNNSETAGSVEQPTLS